MKKIKWLLLLILFCPLWVHASTNTFTRSADNPLVPKDVVVSTTNLEDILKTPAVSASEKVYDYADLYTDQQEKLLFKKIDSYIDKSDIDLVVITTTDLNGFSLSQYTYNFYDYNDFKIEGIAFVIYLAPSEPQVYMGNSGDKTGKVFSIYSKVYIEQTLKYIYKDLKAANYYDATSDFIDIVDGLYDKSGNSGNYEISEKGEVVRQIPWIEIVILSIASTFIVVILFVFKIRKNNRLSNKDILSNKIDQRTLMFKTETDEYVGTSILRKK